MSSNFKSKQSLLAAIALIGILTAIFIAVLGFQHAALPLILKPIATAVQPTASPLSGYQPEVIPFPTDPSVPTQSATITPTITPNPTRTLIVIPTLVAINQLLPDLTVAGIGDPKCASSNVEGTLRRYVKLTLVIRNIGRVSTNYFGSFDVGVYIILGQRSYGLDEWAGKFNGVIGNPLIKIAALSPKQDVSYTLAIDTKGNKNFGIMAVVNSGSSPIRETDTNNNTLIKYFSVYCY
jgi:hypothetical protein